MSAEPSHPVWISITEALMEISRENCTSDCCSSERFCGTNTFVILFVPDNRHDSHLMLILTNKPQQIHFASVTEDT